MPTYCKAYLVRDLKRFEGWSRPATEGLADDDVCYLWSDFTVTRDCLGEKEPSLLEVSPQWQAFCTGALKFELPADLRGD